MADKEKYFIPIEGKLIEVEENVYLAYFRMERNERWQEGKKGHHKVLSYDALDDGEILGIENIADVTALTMDEITYAHELRDKVRHAIALLPKAQRELIHALYYKELSEWEAAKRSGVSQNKIHKDRKKILEKLRLILNIADEF